ncbi:MAG: metallophosphoesterase [Candidatus Latescibacteria bacterium]|nr:metallophosphoesterase [Candidatus Latescibacterota bacterium]
MPCRFAVMSDTHFTALPSTYEGTWWNRTTERFSDIMGEALVTLVHKLTPDFVIHCGDFVGVCSQKSYEFGSDIMNRLGCPWYMVPGNHDTWCSETRNLIRDQFDIANNGCTYMRDKENIRFFFLDVSAWYNEDSGISPVLDHDAYKSGRIKGMGPFESDIVWLDKSLVNTHTPAVLITHAPLEFKHTYPVSTFPHGKPVKGPQSEPSEFIPDIINRTKLKNIIEKHNNLKVCFAGHWHINDVFMENGIWYIMTAALREFPYEIRLVEYDNDEFRITTHRLDVPDLVEKSYVKEWNNTWIEGDQDVRVVTCHLR